jgi:hypothetical protein
VNVLLDENFPLGCSALNAMIDSGQKFELVYVRTDDEHE